MEHSTHIYAKDNIKDLKGVFFDFATVNIYPDGRMEYCAQITDGSRPAPYIDYEQMQIVCPRGQERIIINAAETWADALEQLQAIADQYGTLRGGAFVMQLVCTAADLDDEEPAAGTKKRRSKKKAATMND